MRGRGGTDCEGLEVIGLEVAKNEGALVGCDVEGVAAILGRRRAEGDLRGVQM